MRGPHSTPLVILLLHPHTTCLNISKAVPVCFSAGSKVVVTYCVCGANDVAYLFCEFLFLENFIDQRLSVCITLFSGECVPTARVGLFVIPVLGSARAARRSSKYHT